MKTCLVVEDNEIVRAIMMDCLQDLGLVVVEKDNAHDAVDYCSMTKPDVVLLDWDLPSLSALDFLRGVGSFEKELRPEIVLCATENDAEQFSLAKAAGARHHILKPFDKPLLASKLIEVGVLDSPIHEEPEAVAENAEEDVAENISENAAENNVKKDVAGQQNLSTTMVKDRATMSTQERLKALVDRVANSG